MPGRQSFVYKIVASGAQFVVSQHDLCLSCSQEDPKNQQRLSLPHCGPYPLHDTLAPARSKANAIATVAAKIPRRVWKQPVP